MSKVIEEANNLMVNDEAEGFYSTYAAKADDCMLRLITELESKNKEIERYEKIVKAAVKRITELETANIKMSGAIIELSEWIENSTCFDGEYDLTKVRAIAKGEK